MLPIETITALFVGLVSGYWIYHLYLNSKKNSLELWLKENELEAEKKALSIIEAAEKKSKTITTEVEAEKKRQEQRLEQKEEHLSKREDFLDNKQQEVDEQKKNIASKIEEIRNIRNQLNERSQKIDQELERVVSLSKEEAYQKLITSIKQERENDLKVLLNKLDDANHNQYKEVAKNLLLAAIHRVGNSLPSDVMTSCVDIASVDLKGKIIGKEGRNIKAFERATGVDLLIDESPDYIVLSSFDPIRREIAKVALGSLLEDGRIQPSRIEEKVKEARIQVSKTVKEMGEKAAYEAKVTNLHPDLLSILGRLHFRTSYGQNVLWHSVEMAHLASIIAEEIGADVTIARAGALLHDIGKSVSHEVPGTHVEIGIKILEKYNVSNSVILAMRAHHEEYPYETPESIIVQVADAISGSRPGARRDSLERYIKRLSELENIATRLEGVEKAFALSAGREIRVMINPVVLNDFEANELARKIATDIEAELRYPGEIKVHVIRETRVISYAR